MASYKFKKGGVSVHAMRRLTSFIASIAFLFSIVLYAQTRPEAAVEGRELSGAMQVDSTAGR